MNYDAIRILSGKSYLLQSAIWAWDANKGIIHWHWQWKGKWKSNPFTGLDNPWGFQEVKNPKFQDNRHTKVVGLSALRTGRLYPTENIPGTRFRCGPGISVGIATDYGLGGLGIESRWGARFSALQDRPWGPPSLLYNGYRVFPGGKVRPGRSADHSPLSSAEVLEE
jgi:hypothetical protein